MPLVGAGLSVHLTPWLSLNLAYRQMIGVKNVGPIFTLPAGVASRFL